MKTGNTCASTDPAIWHEHASMEPGHEDREYTSQAGSAPTASSPQWSPVMKTGNTRIHRVDAPQAPLASMEPGHEDREYVPGPSGYTHSI